MIYPPSSHHLVHSSLFPPFFFFLYIFFKPFLHFFVPIFLLKFPSESSFSKLPFFRYQKLFKIPFRPPPFKFRSQTIQPRLLYLFQYHFKFSFFLFDFIYLSIFTFLFSISCFLFTFCIIYPTASVPACLICKHNSQRVSFTQASSSVINPFTSRMFYKNIKLT